MKDQFTIALNELLQFECDESLVREYIAFVRACSRRIQKPGARGGMHEHHIVPRCLGGSELESNLASLSLHDHARAHALLAEAMPWHEGLQNAASLIKGTFDKVTSPPNLRRKREIDWSDWEFRQQSPNHYVWIPPEPEKQEPEKQEPKAQPQPEPEIKKVKKKARASATAPTYSALKKISSLGFFQKRNPA